MGTNVRFFVQNLTVSIFALMAAYDWLMTKGGGQIFTVCFQWILAVGPAVYAPLLI